MVEHRGNGDLDRTQSAGQERDPRRDDAGDVGEHDEAEVDVRVRGIQRDPQAARVGDPPRRGGEPDRDPPNRSPEQPEQARVLVDPGGAQLGPSLLAVAGQPPHRVGCELPDERPPDQRHDAHRDGGQPRGDEQQRDRVVGIGMRDHHDDGRGNRGGDDEGPQLHPARDEERGDRVLPADPSALELGRRQGDALGRSHR